MVGRIAVLSYVLSISSCTRRSHSLRGCPMMKRTTVREVPTPPSPSPAPFRLRTWLAYVERISMRLSTPVSMLKTPRNSPMGASSSKSAGGKEVGVKVPLGGCMGNESYGPRYGKGGGSVVKLGIVQYPRQGRGCLSGLQRYIMRCVSEMANAVNRSRENICRYSICKGTCVKSWWWYAL